MILHDEAKPASGTHAFALHAELMPGRYRTALRHLGVGVLAGASLWALQRWRASSGPLHGALVYLVLATSLSWVLSQGAFTTERRRVGFAVMLGSVFALLGAHAGASWMVSYRASFLFGHVLAAAVVGFVVVALAAGVQAAPLRFDYRQLFEQTWRNALLVPISTALTAVLWVLLWAAAWLMDSIGLPAMSRLLAQPAFGIIVTAGAFGLASGLVLEHVDTLLALRRAGLSLITWFLPLALTFAVAWLGALAFTGVEPLFATRHAAFYLFWFVALTTAFANAAFQDGREPRPFPGWMAQSLPLAWLAMPALALLGDWALGQRVAQHGWTEDRLWGAVVGLLVTLYASGYAASVLRRRRGWMASLPATNIVAALAMVVAVTLLISPLADVRGIAVRHQVARLQSGQVEPAAFDWDHLRRDRAYGRAALQALSSAPGTDLRSREVARLAADALKRDDAEGSSAQDSHEARAALLRQVRVLPSGQVPDPDLLERLIRPEAHWDERSCVRQPAACHLWLVDMDGNALGDAVLLVEHGNDVQATLYAKEPFGWREQGRLKGGPATLSGWRSAIESGKLARTPPRWPDLSLDDRRIEFDR
ncbi:DUF4153 domain-containing protein [Aquabacterium sp. A7-Y]|uniref:DUF4153 domain-containing protein n=1 Tax=Aquabacterium sp. A7-Y TaxID=1349605 RepID=UPI00223DC53E|nr:DUF4153 domain-containing protein [Aquabacterium sp. A7-Y]MCW7539659.1 DUF4153 domain-containing protein [Aquabacterium sp. A7-Y]